jgi:hypothetical protein
VPQKQPPANTAVRSEPDAPGEPDIEAGTEDACPAAGADADADADANDHICKPSAIDTAAIEIFMLLIEISMESIPLAAQARAAKTIAAEFMQ